MKLFSVEDGRYTVAHETDSGVILETRQDVSQIIEANKRQYNDSDGKFDDVITHVARLPLTVVDDLNRKGIMRGFKVIDQTRFKAFLNHPDNRFFRTHPGKI
jgi:Fe-S cluster assembly ATPase SufC